MIGCPYPAPRWNRAVKRIIHLFGNEAKVLDLGAGAGRLATNIINLDIVETAFNHGKVLFKGNIKP